MSKSGSNINLFQLVSILLEIWKIWELQCCTHNRHLHFWKQRIFHKTNNFRFFFKKNNNTHCAIFLKWHYSRNMNFDTHRTSELQKPFSVDGQNLNSSKMGANNCFYFSNDLLFWFPPFVYKSFIHYGMESELHVFLCICMQLHTLAIFWFNCMHW